MKERILLGQWTEEEIDDLLKEAPPVSNPAKRINFLSRQFLGVGYKESTLLGDASTPETFVINLGAVDCFTFLDYIEAMRLSNSFAEFRENLIRVRYRLGRVAYENRNHFFTDWVEHNSDFVEDVTPRIGNDSCRRIEKFLNRKEDGSSFLPGIPVRKREISYTPSEVIDDFVIGKLKTADYIGIYSEKEGLDVSHVGIIIKEKDKVKFRHASSVKRRVIDEDFMEYVKDKPGIVVLRPK